MKLVQTAFDVIELSPEAKKWRRTLNELYAIYAFLCSYHQEKMLNQIQFESELREIIRQSFESYKTYHFECFKLNGTNTGVALRLNLRWFVKRLAK